MVAAFAFVSDFIYFRLPMPTVLWLLFSIVSYTPSIVVFAYSPAPHSFILTLFVPVEYSIVASYTCVLENQ